MPKRQALANLSQNSNTVGGYKPCGFAAVVSMSNSAAGGSWKTPYLTDNECSLLFKHQGCLMCQHRYQSHCATECPNDFPDGQNYKEITEDVLLGHKRHVNVPSEAKPIGVVASNTSHIKECQRRRILW